MTALRTVLSAFGLALLAACATEPTMSGATLDVSSADTVARQFDCQVTGPDGRCDVKQCKSGPGGAEWDCARYAYYCVKAGHKWEGTKDLGKCIRMHPG